MKFICIGKNYSEHIREMGAEKPSEPVIFIKPDSSLIQKNNPFITPPFSNKIHYEIEILVRISKLGRHIQEEFSHKYYNEITVGIDFTARDYQSELKKKGLPWEKSKAFDGSALVGEWKEKSTFKDLKSLEFYLLKNQKKVQQSNISNMLWGIDELISYSSKFFTLKIGDILFTGTPSGVGPVKKNDSLEGFLNGERLFSIKVK
ncbi:MAG: fumarylacetoacetate hydrolase family protein [Bacteroidota bacterium]|nr:fumarylacetoacetate hydrolase family protein [Bacteroidota bacterium]